MLARFRSLGLVVLWSLGPFLFAHDPYESTTIIIVGPDRMELTIAMAQSTALRLIDPDVRIRALTPENMPEHTPRLEREARLLFILTSLGKQLVPTKVRVELTDENDIVYTVTYPRPAAGRLLIHASFLRRLGDGYGGLVTVDDEANRNLGWDQLRWPHASFEVTAPVPTPEKK